MNDEKLRHTIGKRIRIARIEQDLNQEKLAQLLDTHTTTISRWERGNADVPMIKAVQIAAALKKELRYFILPFDTGSEN